MGIADSGSFSVSLNKSMEYTKYVYITKNKQYTVNTGVCSAFIKYLQFFMHFLKLCKYGFKRWFKIKQYIDWYKSEA